MTIPMSDLVRELSELSFNFSRMLISLSHSFILHITSSFFYFLFPSLFPFSIFLSTYLIPNFSFSCSSTNSLSPIKQLLSSLHLLPCGYLGRSLLCFRQEWKTSSFFHSSSTFSSSLLKEIWSTSGTDCRRSPILLLSPVLQLFPPAGGNKVCRAFQYENMLCCYSVYCILIHLVLYFFIILKLCVYSSQFALYYWHIGKGMWYVQSNLSRTYDAHNVPLNTKPYNESYNNIWHMWELLSVITTLSQIIMPLHSSMLLW